MNGELQTSHSTTTLTPVGYRERIAETEAQSTLGTARALLVEGPKGCGNTWFAKRFARSEVLLEQDRAALTLVQAVPDRVLEGATPRLHRRVAARSSAVGSHQGHL